MLRKKADYIISNSRISRTEVEIADPDQQSAERILPIDLPEEPETSVPEPPEVEESATVAVVVAQTDESAKECVVTSQQSVEAEVHKGKSTAMEPIQRAETVKLKSRRCHLL